MRKRKKSRVPTSTLDGQLHSDSHFDPRVFFTSPANRKQHRKASQLCRQVFETLSFVLYDLRCEALQDLLVVSVDPAPDASRLMVTVESSTDVGPAGDAAIMEALNEQSGRLRCEIAASITRKRVPTLVFRVSRRTSVRHDA